MQHHDGGGVRRFEIRPGEPPTWQGMSPAARTVAAFGRFRFTVTALLAEGDHVYVRWRQDGHHLGDVDGHPPTGAPLTEVGSAVYRVEDGRVAEYWVQLDRLGLARQLRDGGGAG
ncbi:ester cyclase [Dactylosporangium aurantiacum]|nr:ester cyclase [Dactylosporangium aurantiacum]MDG6109011.1 ester cyclase [Dactylosporangium aurantiacum]